MVFGAMGGGGGGGDLFGGFFSEEEWGNLTVSVFPNKFVEAPFSIKLFSWAGDLFQLVFLLLVFFCCVCSLKRRPREKRNQKVRYL